MTSTTTTLPLKVMFVWTMWTQFVLGWLLLPLQTLPDLGDLALYDLPSVMVDGTKVCFPPSPPAASSVNPPLPSTFPSVV